MIDGLDRSVVISSWGTFEGDAGYRFYADVNGDDGVDGTDLPFITNNWGKWFDDPNLRYPAPLRAADAVFAAYESGDLDVDLDVF